jgi:hypothetical protein
LSRRGNGHTESGKEDSSAHDIPSRVNNSLTLDAHTLFPTTLRHLKAASPLRFALWLSECTNDLSPMESHFFRKTCSRGLILF